MDGGARTAIDAVVLGTSAGGVDALLALLAPLPASYAVPILAVVHLGRGQSSLLVDVLRGRIALPVREAEDKELLAPGVVVAPADYHLLVDGPPFVRARDAAVWTALSNDPPVVFSRPSIDVLFESAADVLGPRAAGVVLTGASQDGAAGLAAIRRRGGFCVAQDPARAWAPFMPAAAIARATPQLVKDLEGISRWLVSLDRGTMEVTRDG